jgi:CheY-like chemotaxis protein
MNILIIDDNEIVCKAISFSLLSEGYSVALALTSEKALEHINNNLVFDVILCDIMLPGLTGPSFLLKIQQYIKTHHTRIFVMSAIKDGEQLLKKLEIPFERFIEKPFEADTFIQYL